MTTTDRWSPVGSSNRLLRRRPARFAAVAGMAVLLGALLPAPSVLAVALVKLSGVVSDASGAPVSGTEVSFNAESMVTGANGSYALYVPPDVSSTLQFQASGAMAAPLSLLRADGEFTVGSIDVVENFDWPAPTQVQLTVVDATSVPLVGSVVNGGGGDLQEPLSDGITSVSLSYSMPSYPANTCTTDGAGQCALPGLVGATTSFYSTYQQPPGGTNYPTFYVYVYPVITAASNVTIQFPSVALVKLSGVVSDASGAPVSGTEVSFNAESMVTGANGSYALYVPPDVSSTLQFQASGAMAAPLSLLRADGEFTVGSIDVVENFDWPAPTQVQLTVVDATSVPLVGSVVNGGGGDLQEPLSDGITSVSLSYSMPSYPANTCTTDGAGQCALPGLVGATTSFYSTYQQPLVVPTTPTFYVYVYPVITAASNVTIQFPSVALVKLSGWSRCVRGAGVWYGGVVQRRIHGHRCEWFVRPVRAARCGVRRCSSRRVARWRLSAEPSCVPTVSSRWVRSMSWRTSTGRLRHRCS